MTDSSTDTDKNTRLQQGLDRKTIELIDDTAGSIRDRIRGTVYLSNSSQLVACHPALGTCAGLIESSMRKMN